MLALSLPHLLADSPATVPSGPSPEQALVSVRAYLDRWDAFALSEEARIPQREAYRAASGEVEAVRFTVDLLTRMSGDAASSSEVLADVRRRTFELAARLRWAAEAPEERACLAEAEVAVWQDKFDSLPQEQRAYLDENAREDMLRAALDELE